MNNAKIDLSHPISETVADAEFDVERSRQVSRELVFSNEHESTDVSDGAPTGNATVNPFEART